jgi:transcription factor CON7
MLLLRHNPPLPDLDASSLRLRSSSYPSYNTIPSKQFTHSPSEEILSHYVHTTFPLHPPLSMYSSSQDQRNESLVDSWLPSTAGSSADVSHPADASSTLAAPSAISSKSNNYSPSHTATTAHNDQTRHARFHHTPGGSPSDRHQSFSSQHHPSSLNRHLSEPNIRAAATQPPPHYPFSHATEARYPQQQRRPPHRQSFQHGVTPVLLSPGSASVSADRRPSTAGSAASSSWESRGAESLQGITAATQTHGAHASLESSSILLNDLPFPCLPDLPPIAAGDQNTSPVERYPPMYANPFGDHNFADARPRSSGIVGADSLHSGTAHPRLHSPASSLVPVARHGSEEEHDIVTVDPAISKTYSFVSLPGNAVKKRPRRRYDEIERLYHCSWSGCTKSYGTLNHLNAHIVMQRHGGKRTPAGEVHSLFHD